MSRPSAEGNKRARLHDGVFARATGRRRVDSRQRLDVKYCSVCRPTGIRLQPGTQRYRIGRCKKDSNKRRSVFVDNVKMQLDGEDGFKVYQHAWKYSEVATKKPLIEARGQ